MRVYPSVRAAFLPDTVNAATRANATTASLEGTDRPSGARLGVPFPIPKNGAEVIWNHKLKFRSEEHTSELQSLMRISYAVFCLKKKHHIQKSYAQTTH